MIMKIVKWIVLVPIAVALVAFAVANRQSVVVSLDPFGADPPVFALSAPLSVVLLVTLVIGVIIGGLATWVGQGRWRRAARRKDRQLRRMTAETDRREDAPLRLT